jgi:hypothetical protein
MRESLLQVSTRCLHTQLKAGPEKAPAKTTVEARKVYPESAEGFTLSLPKGGLLKSFPVSSRIVRARKSMPPCYYRFNAVISNEIRRCFDRNCGKKLKLCERWNQPQHLVHL